MSDLAQAALDVFDRLVGSVPAFRQRPGQRDMVRAVAEAFARAEVGPASPSLEREEPKVEPARAIGIIQAGTGVGKSAAYIVPGVHIARARKVPLVLSTATTALQAQLVDKDLPAISAAMDEPFTFAIAKGRNRYLCLSKAMRLAGVESMGELDLGEDDDEVQCVDRKASAAAPPSSISERRVDFAGTILEKVDQGWDGDRDSLLDPPPPDLWAQLSAEQTTCTARGCPQYTQCSYYRARNRLRSVDVIVANHSLVLSAIGTKILPPLEEALWVFDEGHHLPQIAVDQFAAVADLTALRWLDRLPVTITKVAAKLDHQLNAPIPQISRELKASLGDLGRMVFDLYASVLTKANTYRFKSGRLPAFALDPLQMAQARATALLSAMDSMVTVIRERIRDEPENRVLWGTLFASLGKHVPRLRALIEATSLLLDNENAETTAKWLTVSPAGSGVSIKLSACPVLPGPLLERELWGPIRGAVVTSATLTACGTFGYFMDEAGMSNDPDVKPLTVASPFDYARQGQVVIVNTEANPRQLDAFQQEVSSRIGQDLVHVQGGALGLFTSKAHMQRTYQMLAPEMRGKVLMQGEMSRSALIALHRERVESGQPSILFGLQSFGEGLDLPGRLCEVLFIAKLPFATPTDPVGEARADYVESQGGSAFDELTVPEAGIRLLQWTGRGIRTEEDTAKIVIYDKRLIHTRYGQRILGGLPPYPVSQVHARAF